ncbi:hypothetical protein NDU88_005487 [Pleurodeles waltl]|uniref:Uncharacterized protein n=1 Tax=Pleurodeles waltl TaxID=8319 RepID=A0AAV7UKA0_PLEWA|nr:hypothetical protein NDU88_005487 [Pleurodeles waltl]
MPARGSEGVGGSPPDPYLRLGAVVHYLTEGYRVVEDTEVPVEERPKLSRKGNEGTEEGPREREGARPKEWSLPIRRGRRRQRVGRDTPWRLPRQPEKEADTTDSEGNHSASLRKRHGSADMDSLTPESRLDQGGESPHPLLEAIDNMEAEKEARRPKCPEG